MDYEEHLRKRASEDLPDYQPPARTVLPQVEASGGITIEQSTSGDFTVSAPRVFPKKNVEEEPADSGSEEEPASVCCPEEFQGTEDAIKEAWDNNDKKLLADFTIPGFQHKMCVRFIWVCSCPDEPICKYQVFGDNEKSLNTPEQYIEAITPFVDVTACVQYVFAIEFFGQRQFNPAYVDEDTTPDIPRRIYVKRGDSYKIFLLLKAHTG